MDAKALIARMEAQRSSWVMLGEGRRVRFVRPPELELVHLMDGVRAEHVVRYVTGWEGFTEATLLGPAHGSGDTQLPFDRDLWQAYVSDQAEECRLVAEAITATTAEYLQRRQETAKNSKPSST